MFLAPTMIQMFVDSPEARERDLSSLDHLLYGASPISEAVLGRTMALLPRVRLLQAYGMTELSPTTTILTSEDHLKGDLRRSAGRAVPYAEVRIVDAEDREVPRGTVGEIVARGPHVMLGYWNRPEETAAALRGGWMHTGDGGRMDEAGYVFVVDRIKDMIVSGGENVYSAEIENALSTHHAVAACAVIGVPDPEWGERVHAVVVLREGCAAPEVEELRAHCAERIARYKAPRSVEVVDALPLTPAAKVTSASCAPATGTGQTARCPDSAHRRAELAGHADAEDAQHLSHCGVEPDREHGVHAEIGEDGRGGPGRVVRSRSWPKPAGLRMR